MKLNDEVYMALTDYTVVVGDHPDDLQTKVAEKIADGYQPFGAPIIQWGSFSMVQVVAKGDGGGGEGGGGTVSIDNITDASAPVKTMLKQQTNEQILSTIGAGTSNLKIGTAATDAKAGNYQPATADISDASDVGKQLLKAADAAAARTAIGAGEPYTLPAATASAVGGVKMAAAMADLTAAPTQADFNGLLAALRAAGQIAT
ncbi:TPA: head fiber protein [Serratia marcescens]